MSDLVHARTMELEDEVLRLRDVNAELLTMLKWLDHKGGLGIDVHERIQAAIDRATKAANCTNHF